MNDKIIYEKVGVDYNFKNRTYDICLYKSNEENYEVITIREDALKSVAQQILNVDIRVLEALKLQNSKQDLQINDLTNSNVKLINAITKLIDKL